MGTAIQDTPTGSDLLVCFKSTYLKALAQAWRNKDYEACFTDGRDILEWSGFLKFMPGNEECFGYEFIKGVGYECTKPEQVKKLPWTARVTITKNEEGPEYDPILTAGWMGPHDKFTIVIPPAPNSPSDYPAALAAYLQQFPTLLGYNPDQSGDANQWNFSAAEPNFLAFSNMFAQGIPFCWTKLPLAKLRREMAGDNRGRFGIQSEENSFLNLLITDLFDANGTLNASTIPGEHGTTILSKYLGFNNPWFFNFVFLDAANINASLKPFNGKGVPPAANELSQLFFKDGQYQEVCWDSDNKQWKNLFNVVTLNFPNKPVTPLSDERAAKADPQIAAIVEAHALATYNQSIAYYPFSCA